MNRLCQLSQSTRLDGVFSVLKVSDCALGNSGLARETFGKKLLRFLSGFDPGISDRPLFRIREKSHPPSLGLPLQLTSTDQPARPTRGRLFADGMKFTCRDVPTPSRPIVLLVQMPPLGLGAQNLLSALDRMRLISSSIVLRDNQPGGLGNLG